MTASHNVLISRDGPWWVGWVEEIPGLNTQECSSEQLLDTLRVVLCEAHELNREEARQATGANDEEIAFTL